MSAHRTALLVAGQPSSDGNMAVLCGTVTKICGSEVTIRNRQHMPVSGTEAALSAVCTFPEEEIRRMHLKEGSTVMALAESNDAADIILEGGELQRLDPLKGVRMRYTGAFTLPGRRNRKRREVLCGTVCEEKSGYSETCQAYWHRYEITYTEKGTRLWRKAVEYSRDRQTPPLLGRKVVIAALPDGKGSLTATQVCVLEEEEQND